MSFGEWVSRQLSSQQTRKHRAKCRHRKASRLRVEELEARRLLALTVTNQGGTWLFAPDQNMQFADMTTGPDPDYYLVELFFQKGTNQVQWQWSRLTSYAETLHPDPMGKPTNYPTQGGGQFNATPGAGPAIEFQGNDPGAATNTLGAVNELELLDVSGGTGQPGQDETFGMDEWNDPRFAATGTTLIGPAIEYDPRPDIPDSNLATPNIMTLWVNTANTAFAGVPGGNSSTLLQPLGLFDVSGATTGPGQTGGDRFAVKATDPLTDTFLGGGNPVHLGQFQPPTSANYVGDEYDISSDAIDNDGPNFAGDLNGILGPITIESGAGQATVIISDKGNTTHTAPTAVTFSSTPDGDPTGKEIEGTITGLAAVPINYVNLVPLDPFNPANQISTINMTIIGADAAPTTLPPPGTPYATYTIAGTLEFSNITGQPTWANTLTIDGGASGFNEFDVQASTANFLVLNTGDGDGNVVNVASDGPMNTGDMTQIQSAIVVNGGAGTGNTVNLVDLTDPTAVAATVATVTGGGGANQLQAGVTYTQFSGFAPQTISLAQSTGGQLSANVLGSATQPLAFNLQSDSLTALVVTTGDADGNQVVLSSKAPLLTGNVDAITSTVTINFGMGMKNTLAISDQTGATSVSALFQNDATGTFNQVTGFASPLIEYDEKAGGHLDVSLFGPNTMSATFTVASTLGAGTTLALTGGAIGGNTFNIQGAAADTLTINTGNGPANAVNLTKAGDLTGILSAVTVHGGAAKNSLTITDSAGPSGAAVTLTSGQIAGWTTNPVAYDEAATGSIAISLVGPKAAGTSAKPNTFLVTSTLPKGSTVALQGGTGGFNTFNIGSATSPTGGTGQLDLITAAVTVNGGTGPNNKLEIDDHGSTGAFNYVLTTSKVSTDASLTPRLFGGLSYSNIVAFQLDATGQQNLISVVPSTTITYTINGWGPTATGLPGGNVPLGTGDVLSIDFTGTLGSSISRTAVPAGGNSFNGAWTFTNRKAVNFSSIEDFPVQILAYGADASTSGAPMVKVLNAVSNTVISTFNAFPNEPTFHGGVRVATGYFDASGQQEIAVVPGPGHTPIVKVFDRFGTLLYSFNPGYASNYKGGFNIAAGNIEGLHAGSSSIDDIVTVPSSGVSDIRVFDKIATAPTLFRELTVWGNRFLGGSSVAVADMNLDGRADVIVGSGPGLAPTIDVFDVSSVAASLTPMRVLHPFSIGYLGGVNVSAISMVTGVASPLIVASQGTSSAPTVQIFNGLTGAVVNTSTPFTAGGSNAPVRTAERVINGHVMVFAAQQTNANSTKIRQLDLSNPAAGYVDYILETDPNFRFGVFLG